MVPLARPRWRSVAIPSAFSSLSSMSSANVSPTMAWKVRSATRACTSTTRPKRSTSIHDTAESLTACNCAGELSPALSHHLAAVLVLYFRYFLKWDDDLATSIYHTFVALCYLTPILGAIVADSWLGKFKWVSDSGVAQVNMATPVPHPTWWTPSYSPQDHHLPVHRLHHRTAHHGSQYN